METKEDLIAKFKAYRQLQQEEAQSRLRSAAEHGVKYSSEHRSENLRLLRAFFSVTQESFASLIGINSQSKYSSIEGDKLPLSTSAARSIELELGIPTNWLDRSNLNALFLTQDELSLVNEIRRVKPEAVLKLAETVKLLSGPSF